MGQYTSYYLYQRYEQRDGQDAIPCIPNIYSIDGYGTMQEVIKLDDDPDCGYTPSIEPIYRWYQIPIEQGYICSSCGAPSVTGDYLTYVALEDALIGSNMQGLRYSLDSGNTWYVIDGSVSSYIDTWDGSKSYYVSNLIPSGSRVLLKGCFNHNNYIGTPRLNINSTGRFSLEGNPLSVIYGDNFQNKVGGQIYKYAFHQMFAGNLNLISASNLIIPSVLSENCCVRMFMHCTSLTAAPPLPATTLTNGCYLQMFLGCSSLTTAPELPSTTLASSCYSDMFAFCSSLTTAPVLPATTMVGDCYSGMFMQCTSLTTAPVLPATTLANNCYRLMFSSCSSLTTAPELPVTTLASGCYSYMFAACSSLTTPPELPATTLENNCYQGMFSGCTSFTDLCNYELNAMTLAEYCYSSMFSKCTNLTYAPSNLPAVHLAEGCYKDMFSYCTSLIRAPRKIDVDCLRPESCDNMFYYCSSLVEPCYLYVTECFGDCVNCSYMSNMYANCSELDHMEFIVHKPYGLSTFEFRNWLSNTKEPFYLLTDGCTFGYSKEDISSAYTSSSSHYEYNSLTRYWTELGWSVNAHGTIEDEIITLTTPIENITSVKILPRDVSDNRYIIMKSMDDSIEIMVNGHKFEVVSGESFYVDEILGDEDCDWVTPAYYSWCNSSIHYDQPDCIIFADIDLYKHFGKKFYIETINNANYKIVTGTPRPQYCEENIPSILSYMADIVTDLENKCEGTPIYRWNTNGVINENNTKYEREIYQKTLNDGTTWINVSPTEERKGNIILERQFRWVNLDPSTDYYCNGTTKIYKQQKQMSYDGINWENVAPAEYRQGDIVQTESTDCGYIPTPPEGTKWIATYSGEVITSGECDSTSAITYSEVSPKNFILFALGTCVTEIGNFVFQNCGGLTSINIPNVTKIGWGAFQGCSGLTSIDIPNSVTSIGQSAFANCSGLTSVSIPSGVTSIESSTFSHCSGLTSVTIPNSVTSIGYYAFEYCSGLTSIDIPNSVTSIDYSAFQYCTRLTSVIIPSGVTSISSGVFRWCSSLTSVTMSNAVTSIGQNAFYLCNNLTNIEIPSGITSIGQAAFYTCRSLTSVTIPDTITNIGMQAFIACDGLTSITINAITPPTLGDRAFAGTNNCPIYVPAESVELYKTYSSWKDYKSRLQAIP